jgi:hypothetical protein
MTMTENTEKIPLGPPITTASGEKYYPYQEQKEKWGKKFNIVIVFGQGPVKPVLLPDELTKEQKRLWQEFKTDPLHKIEPDFRVVEGVYLKELQEIDERNDLSQEQKNKLKEEKRKEWQQVGRFGLNRWGRENALAAGLALYLGITDKLILSGGRTIPDWYKENLKKRWLSTRKFIITFSSLIKL